MSAGSMSCNACFCQVCCSSLFASGKDRKSTAFHGLLCIHPITSGLFSMWLLSVHVTLVVFVLYAGVVMPAGRTCM